MGWSSDSSRSDKSGLSGYSDNGEIAEPDVPYLNGRPPTWNLPQNPHLSHLNDSYSEYSGTSVTSSPLSTDSHGISSQNGPNTANELYLASRFGGYMQQQNPYAYGPLYTGSYQGGATNFGLINDIHASANPVDIPNTQHFPVGIRFAFPRMGYGTSALHPYQAQTALSTNRPNFKSATNGNLEHHNHHEIYQTETGHIDSAHTKNDQTKTSYNGYVHVDYAEDDEPPLVVDDSFSSSDNEDEVVRESGIPTVIDSDDEAPPTKMWRIEPSMDSFWQYKKQIKGPAPKSYKLPVKSVSSNPHEPTRYVDPAFDRHNPIDISHFGKARIGEGNDITPNPEKLKDLGNEIEELSEKMLNLTETKAKRTQVSSKISRLKKVANHEANKIKFDGLEKEREEISLVIREATKAMSSGAKLDKSVTEHIDNLKERTLRTQVAGRTGAYVDSLLDEQS